MAGHEVTLFLGGIEIVIDRERGGEKFIIYQQRSGKERSESERLRERKIERDKEREGENVGVFFH